MNYYSDVEWITDCKYELKNHRNHNGKFEKDELNSVYTVEIIKIMRDSVRIKTSANYSDKCLERTLKIIEIK